MAKSGKRDMKESSSIQSLFGNEEIREKTVGTILSYLINNAMKSRKRMYIYNDINY